MGRDFVVPDTACVDRFRRDVWRVIARAFDGGLLSDSHPLALAVSGGPDSMAMLALAAAAFPGRVKVATFNHRLRPTADEDAKLVARVCEERHLSHATLIADAPLEGSSQQMRARDARYAALVRWAAVTGEYGLLLTAHHADDQAETLLMRLNRASGISGLSAIRESRFTGEQVVILRPLLQWRRSDLAAVVSQCGLPIVTDPANSDPRHDRTRYRALLSNEPLLDPAALAASAGYLAEAEDELWCRAELLWSERWHGGERGLQLDDLSRELQRRLVRKAILDVRERLTIILPRFDLASNVEPLLDAIEAHRGAVQGGVKVTPEGSVVTFRPAPPRRSL